MKDKILIDLTTSDMTMTEVRLFVEWWNDTHGPLERAFMDGDAFAIVCKRHQVQTIYGIVQTKTIPEGRR